MASASRSVAPMPLKRASVPSPRRRWRSIAVIRAIAASSAGVGRLAARGKALAQRQQVEQQLDEDGGVAAQMPAVGQDLALQLGGQQLLRLRQLPLVAGDAQVGVDETDQGEEPGIAVGRIAPGGREVGDLVGEACHDGGVALGLGAIEQQARMRQPGDDAAADDLGRPHVRAAAAGCA